MQLTAMCTAALAAIANFGRSEGVDLNSTGILPGDAGYSVEHWTVEEDLPGRIITSLAQTPDGALWCGGSEELARFDGAHFTKFDPQQTPALQGVRILELRCDQSGRLWIAGIDGTLILYEGGRFRRLNESDGFPSAQAGKMGEVIGEDFWIKGRNDDLFYRYHSGRSEKREYTDAPGSMIDRFLADSTGVRWGVHELNRVMVQFLGQKTEMHLLEAPDGKSRVQAGRLFRLQDGRWATTSTHGIYVLSGAKWNMLHAYTSPIEGAFLDGIQDWVGNFWVSVFDQGLFLSGSNRPTARVALPDQIQRPFLRTILMGREGNIWIGGNDGLYRLRQLPFQSQPPNGESPKHSQTAFVETTDGTLWILHQDGWTRLTKAGWDHARHTYPVAYLWTGCASQDGSVILGYTENGDSDRGFLDKIAPNGQASRIGEVKGIIRVILESKSGEIWTGTEAGLWSRSGGKFAAVQIPEIPGEFSVRGLTEDLQGRLYVSAYGHGLWMRNVDGEWRRLTTRDDSFSREIWGICVDTNGAVWAATDSGLARWQQGKWTAYGTVKGELPRLCRSVVCDNQSGLWLASQFGVARVSLDALNQTTIADDSLLESDWFDRSDGLPSVSCSDEQGSLHKTADGRIWVATLKGAAAVDPAAWHKWRRRVGPPSVFMEAILVDDKLMSDSSKLNGPAKTVETIVRPGAQRVEFRYRVVDLTSNRRTRLRYRLDGFDQEWMDAGEQRTAVYHRLPAGHYCFQAVAANKYGTWTSEGTTASIVAYPHYWQTNWFRGGVGVFLLGALWLSRAATLRRLDRQRQRREEFALGLIQSQEKERKRIAQELHDSLGQDLILIRNAAKLSLRKHAPPPPISEQLTDMAELASHALNNARAITSNLRPPELDRLGLTAALETIVEKHAAHSDIQLKATIQNVNGVWSADEEIHVYRVVQESLNNAFKHAHPQRIQLEVAMLGSEVSIRVDDDGRGFDPEQPAAKGGGIGLAGLRERIRILGGVMELISRRGEGTSFRCRIPISVYGKKKFDQNPNR